MRQPMTMCDSHPIENVQQRHPAPLLRHVGRPASAALRSAALLGESLSAGSAQARCIGLLQHPSGLQFPPRVKRVIYLFQAGGPAQQDLFDYKPLLNQENGQQLPDHVRGGQRLTGMSAQQASIPLAGSIFKFARNMDNPARGSATSCPTIAKSSTTSAS